MNSKLPAIAFTLLTAILLMACTSPSPTPTPLPTDDVSSETPTTAEAAPTDNVLTPDATSAPENTATNTESAVVLPTATMRATPVSLPSFNPTEDRLDTRQVVDGLNLPVFATHAGDGSGRLFIVEKGGTIRILKDGTLNAAPFLDITDRVGSSANEQGLLGLAFDPAFAETGYFWVNYTNLRGNTTISRFSVTDADGDLADSASEQNLLTITQPAVNHNGGMLTFGPDGMLWIGTGDGGAAGDRFGNGQNPATLLGKMLRLDVSSDASLPYTFPADNPWVAEGWNGQDVADEIWAVGLRNPWRFSFDRVTGDLWIADVGQNIYEEVNFVPAGSSGGLNFGWPIMEGFHCYATQNCDQQGLTLPIAEYDHTGHCSITGGYVYRGAEWPQLNGVYLYADYCSGRVWALFPDGSGGWQNPVAFDSSMVVSSFAEDESGELYIVDYSGSLNQIVLDE